MTAILNQPEHWVKYFTNRNLKTKTNATRSGPHSVSSAKGRSVRFAGSRMVRFRSFCDHSRSPGAPTSSILDLASATKRWMVSHPLTGRDSMITYRLLPVAQSDQPPLLQVRNAPVAHGADRQREVPVSCLIRPPAGESASPAGHRKRRLVLCKVLIPNRYGVSATQES